MSILDVLVVRNSTETVLRNKYVAHDCDVIVDAVLSKPKSKKLTSYGFKDNQVYVHVLLDNDLTFLCMCTPEMPHERAYKLLDAIQEKTNDSLSRPQDRSVRRSELLENYVDGLIRLYNNSNHAVTKMDKLKHEVIETSALYTQNLEDIFERGNRLEELKRKTERLKQISEGQMPGYRALEEKKTEQRKERRQRKIGRIIAITTALILFVCLLTLLFLLYFCGGYSFRSCSKD